MLIKCAECGAITGSKPPFGGKYDTEIFLGICEACSIKKNIWVEAKIWELKKRRG